MKLVKTKIPGYLKNPETNIVVNENLTEFELYKATRTKLQQQRAAETELINLQQSVAILQSDMSDIKKMLTILLEKKK